MTATTPATSPATRHPRTTSPTGSTAPAPDLSEELLAVLKRIEDSKVFPAGRPAALRRIRRVASSRPRISSLISTRSTLARAGLLDPARHPDRAGHPGLGRPRGEPGRHRTIRHREDPLIEALAHKVIDAGMRVSWFTLETLTAAIGKIAVDGSIAKTVARITRAD